MAKRGIGSRKGVGAVFGVAFLLIATIVVSGCGDSDSSASGDGGGGGGELAMVGYSTPQVVYEETLEPGFGATPNGSGVSFSNSFGASGDQSRAVAAGQPADVVHFAIETDMTRLVEEGQVDAGWSNQPYNGIVENSVVVFVVRNGNPEGIESFDDLLTKDVSVITPNPFSSGAARWNIMAIYGSQIEQGKSPAQALDAIKTVLEKTEVQPASARDALTAFTQGQGDVLLTYENEAIAAEEAGEDIEFVIPDNTILIETPIAVTKGASSAAQAFVDYLLSDEGQEKWAETGYRPVNPKLVDPKQFPSPPGLFKIAKFGGWEKVKEEFFEEGTGSVTKIEEELGVSTAG